MNRRDILAAFAAGAAGLAGCNARSADLPDPSTTTRRSPVSTATTRGTTTDRGTATHPETTAPNSADEVAPPDEWFSLVDLRTADRTLALAPTRHHTDDGGAMTFRFTGTATADRPATVLVTLTNRNEFENTFRLNEIPGLGRNSAQPADPIDGDSHTTYREALYLAPTGRYDLAADSARYRRASDGRWRLASDPGSAFPETARLKPGETVRAELAVLGHREDEGWPTAAYEFGYEDHFFTVTAWKTSAPGPAETSRFAGADVPSLPHGRDAAWFHDADARTPTYLRPSVERADLPAAVEFTFVNRSRETLGCGGRNLYKLVDGGWFHVGPYFSHDVCHQSRPGDTASTTLRAFHGNPVPYEGRSLDFGHLGGGRYAVSVGFGHETGMSAAMVELAGPPVEVTPTEGLSVERQGSKAVVTSPRHDSDDEHHQPSTLTVTRVDAAGSATSADSTDSVDERLIPEQVMRRYNRGLRNTLSFFSDGTDAVVLKTEDQVVGNVVGYDAKPRRFRFGGRAYEATGEIPEPG